MSLFTIKYVSVAQQDNYHWHRSWVVYLIEHQERAIIRCSDNYYIVAPETPINNFQNLVNLVDLFLDNSGTDCTPKLKIKPYSTPEAPFTRVCHKINRRYIDGSERLSGYRCKLFGTLYNFFPVLQTQTSCYHRLQYWSRWYYKLQHSILSL